MIVQCYRRERRAWPRCRWGIPRSLSSAGSVEQSGIWVVWRDGHMQRLEFREGMPTRGLELYKQHGLDWRDYLGLGDPCRSIEIGRFDAQEWRVPTGDGRLRQLFIFREIR